MKILAGVTVKDDTEVLGPCIANLLRMGVDAVVVVAVAPSEEMRAAFDAIIAQHERTELFVLDALDVGGDFLSTTPEQMAWLMATHRPDWVLLCDADEFLVAEVDDIHDVPELAEGNSLRIERYNYARRLDESAEEILGLTTHLKDAPLVYERSQMQKDGKLIEGGRWLQHRIWHKPMVRTQDLASFGVGFHTAMAPDGKKLKLVTARSLVFVHLPFTSLARFESKVKNAQASLNSLTDLHRRESFSWHWKTWITALEEGRLGEAFEHESFPPEEFASLCDRGAIRTAGEILHEAASGEAAFK